MLTRNRLPNESQAATLSQHEAGIPAPAAIQVAPPSMLRREVAPGFDASNSWFGFVGLTATVPSAWLPAALVTFTLGPTVGLSAAAPRPVSRAKPTATSTEPRRSLLRFMLFPPSPLSLPCVGEPLCAPKHKSISRPTGKVKYGLLNHLSASNGC